MVPRIGAFEVSCVIDSDQQCDPNKSGSTDLMLFSKFLGGMWPHHGAIAERIGKLADDISSGLSNIDFSSFQFNPAGCVKQKTSYGARKKSSIKP